MRVLYAQLLNLFVYSKNSMFVCVNCGHRSKHLLRLYGSSIESGHVRLAVCKACKKDVDKYLEYEGVLLAIDLVLHRTGAFRHLLLNRLYDESQTSYAFSTSPFESMSRIGGTSDLHGPQTQTSESTITISQRGLRLYEGVGAFIFLVLIDSYANLYRSISTFDVFANGGKLRHHLSEGEIDEHGRCNQMRENIIENHRCSSCGPYGPDILFPELDNVVNSTLLSFPMKTSIGEGKGHRFLKLLDNMEFDDFFVQVDSGQYFLSGTGLKMGDYFTSIKASTFEWLTRFLLLIVAVRLFGALRSSRTRSLKQWDTWEFCVSSFLTSVFLRSSLQTQHASISSPATIYSTVNEASRHEIKDESDERKRPFFLIPQWSEGGDIQQSLLTTTESQPLQKVPFPMNQSIPDTFPDSIFSSSLFPSPLELWSILSALLVAACIGRSLLIFSLIFPFPPLLLALTVSFVSFTSTTCALRAVLDCSILTSSCIALSSYSWVFLCFIK